MNWDMLNSWWPEVHWIAWGRLIRDTVEKCYGQVPPGGGSHYYTYTLFISPAWCVIPCCYLWRQWLTELIQQLNRQMWPLPDLDLSNPWDPWYYFLIHRTKLYKILDDKRFHGVHFDSHSEPDRLKPMTCFFCRTWKCLFSVWWYLLERAVE